MGCRSWEGEGVAVGNEDMKTRILCGGIFIHLQIFTRHPVDHWYSEACAAYNSLSDNKCSNFFFFRPHPPTPKGVEIIITECFIGPSPPASLANDILFFIALGTYYQAI